MRKLYLYPHTHWDREWYQPFESFRAQLVDVVRRILDDLDNGKLSHFFLDGQSIIFDDVTEIDPSLRSRLEAHMRSGRLAAGPWYVLADQMLVGGESLVRNLSYGLAGTKNFGEPTMVGYCPDTFGHTADMPRILKGFGIDTAVVWRGVPKLDMGPVFWWYSPDGSRVLTYHLARGYYQTAFHELSGATNGGAPKLEQLGESLLPWVNLGKSNGVVGTYYKAIDGALMPVGGDHIGPPADLSTTVKTLDDRYRKESQELQLEITSLQSFMQRLTKKAGGQNSLVQSLTGELRSNRAAKLYERAYLLYGVLSTRLYLKRLNRLAEYKLARLLEPASAVLSAFKMWNYPALELEHLWKILLKNHPHDSICGCSVDSVHREMVTRFDQIDEVCQTLMQSAASALCLPPEHGVSSSDPAAKRDSLTFLNVTGEAVSAPVPVQWFIELDQPRPKSSDVLQISSIEKVDQLFSGWGSVPYYKELFSVKGWAWAEDIPALGLKTVDWPGSSVKAGAEAVTCGQGKISNGGLTVAVSAAGQLSVRAMTPNGRETYKLLHELRDVGDGGDSYNFDPLPGDKPIKAKFVSVKAGQKGPLVASLVLTYEIELPVMVEADGKQASAKASAAFGRNVQSLVRSKKRKKQLISTEISLKRNVPIVFFETVWDNKSADHRLEIVFETGSEVKETQSENHFSVIRRSHASQKQDKLPVPPGHEAEPDRFPCQRFFLANGQTFFNTGMPEYGVRGSSVSITALRAISYLSQPNLVARGGGAGPNLRTPEANCFGINRCSYGWAPPVVQSGAGAKHSRDAEVAAAYHLAELYEGALWCVPSKGLSRSARGLLQIDNPAVRVVACYKDGKTFVVRLLNCTESEQLARIQVDEAAIEQMQTVRLSLEKEGKVVLSKSDGASSSIWAEILFGKNELKTLTFE